MCINLRSANPWSKTTTAINGEGVLVSVGASVIGFGIESGLGLRSSACDVGMVAFKPTSSRLSKMGINNLYPPSSIDIIPPVPGPIAKVGAFALVILLQ
jgi:Asp-tRNA(Asn)/Glu-tRNA(Gln) amidotransferase A subunit family amidase